MNLYWYELIHRPISTSTQPKEHAGIDLNHINRNGFKFGKVAYKTKLTEEELINYDMEPVNVPGLIELGLISQEKLNMNNLKITVELLHYLLDNGFVNIIQENGWSYIHLEEVKKVSEEKRNELKIIYKQIKRGSKIDRKKSI